MNLPCNYIFCFCAIVSSSGFGIIRSRIQSRTRRPVPRVWYHVENNTRSYYFSPSLKMNIFDAQSSCKKQNATLVSLHSSDENQEILNIVDMYKLTFYNIHRVWLGIRGDAGQIRSQKWLDGSDVDYSNWNKTTEESDDYCVFMVVEYNSKLRGQWYHAHCAENFNFVCTNFSKQTTNETFIETSNVGECDEGWIRYKRACYKIVDSPLTFDAAALICRSKWRADLAMISSDEEQNFFLALFGYKSYNSSFWLGGYALERSYKFRWKNNLPNSYTNWKKRHPKSTSSKRCISILPCISHDCGKWEDIDCTRELPYICEKMPSPTNPTPSESVFPLPCIKREDYLHYRDVCFKFYNEPYDWLHAEEVCKRDGGNLASISDELQQAFLSISMQQRNFTDTWIGVRRASAGHKAIHWTDNRPMYYTNFDYTQRVTNESGCVFMKSSGIWRNEHDCNKRRTFVCKIHYETTTVGQDNTSGNCPSVHSPFVAEGASWVDLDPKLNSCYFVFHREDSIGNAYFECALRGGTLVSIHSEHELKLLAAFAPMVTETRYSDYFLGLYRTSSGDVQWLDGTPLDFSSWQTDEPSNVPSKSCVSASSSLRHWKLVSCRYNRFRYICSVRKIRGGTNTESHVRHSESKSAARIFVPLLSIGMVFFYIMYKFYRQKQSVIPLHKDPKLYHARFQSEN